MKAALSTDGITMTHSALSSRSEGMSSGISRISLRTVPQLSRRSASFCSSAAERGRATIAKDIRVDIIRLITVHLVVVFWARAIIERREAGRNLRLWKRGLVDKLAAGVGSLNRTRGRRDALPFDYTFPERLGHVRNRRAASGRTIESKDRAGVLRREEPECGFEEGHRQIRRAGGSADGNNAHEQGRVGTAHRGCRERRDALRAERGQVFRAGFEHEAVHHGAGAGETGSGVPLPHHAGIARHDFERGSAWRRSHTRRARRSESIEQKIPV